MLNRQLRVFISSTFLDMKDERDALLKDVFLRLKKFCYDKSIYLTEIDLRLGVAQDDIDKGDTLKVCLDEIENCKTSEIFFIGIIGHRYGWNQWNNDKLTNKKSIAKYYPWIYEQNLVDSSITELEILSAINQSKIHGKRAFLYYRDEAFSDNIEQKLSESTSYIQEPEELFIKQKKLKSSLQNIDNIKHSNYDSIQDFKDKVYNDLLYEIKKLFPEENDISKYELYNQNHLRYLLSKINHYEVNSEYEKKLQGFLDGDNQILCVYGKEFLGKTSLLSYFAHKFIQNTNDHCFYHFTLAEDTASSFLLFVNRLNNLLHKRFGFIGDSKILSFRNLSYEFEKLLNSVPMEHKLCIIIDSIDNFDDSLFQSLLWLPNTIPSNSKIIISSREKLKVAELKAKVNYLNVEYLELTQKKQIIEKYFKEFAVKLSHYNLNAIIFAKLTNLPMNLVTILNEIRLYGDYATIDKYIETLLHAESFENLIKIVLERLVNEYSYMEELLSILSISEFGLEEKDLCRLFNITMLQLSPLLISLNQYLIYSDGLIKFKSKDVKKIVNNQYYNKYNYSMYINFLEEKEFDLVKVQELPFQYYTTKNIKKLSQIISNEYVFYFYILKSTIDHNLDIYMNYYKYVESGLVDFSSDFYNTVLEQINSHREHISSDLNNLGYFFFKVGKYELAIEIYSKILEIEYNDTVIDNLGTCYIKVKNYDRAREMLERVYITRKSSLGELHTDTLISQNNYASALLTMGETTKANILLEDVVNKKNDIYGKYHLETYATYTQLINSYCALKKYDIALPLVDDLIDNGLEVFDKNSEIILALLSNKAYILDETEDYDNAIKLYEYLLNQKVDSFNEKSNLAILYDKVNKKDEAKKLFLELYNSSINTTYHFETLSSLIIFLIDYNFLESEKYIKEIVKSFLYISENEQNIVYNVLNTFAKKYEAKNDLLKAILMYKEMISLTTQLDNELNYKNAYFMLEIISLLIDQKKYSDVKPYITKAINIAKINNNHELVYSLEGYQHLAGIPVIPKSKVGRNDPCPCKSGKKYKKCCSKK